MAIKSIIQPIFNPIIRSINKVYSLFSPISLFANGEQGAWYDPSDITTMFQDSAGTTRVTTAGQPVGLIRDKSGRGNHAFQTTTTKRPLYQSAGGYSYLAFDGIDDALVTNSIDFTATDKMTVWAGVQKLSDANVAILLELGNAVQGAFYLSAPDNAGANYGFMLRGINLTGTRLTSYPSPITNTISNKLNLAGAVITDCYSPKVNGSTPIITSSTGSTIPNGGNFSNNPLYIGSRAGTSLPFNGNLYSLVIRGAQSSDAQIASTEQFVNGRTGAY